MATTAIILSFFIIALLILASAFAHPEIEYCDDPSCPCQGSLTADLDDLDEHGN